jgi:selenocysteine-specific elongation factor
VYVIATAGHVDHGKSTLVRALTGMEPDRWAEERRRGMTIDLGFAWTRLPSGRQVAFVDVPGHERFATNMLAGVGSVPAVMLVIAADEGWAAQTEDHVRALHALGVSHGVVAVTRTDLAEPGRAVAEAKQRLAATSLAGIPAVAVSGATGAGLVDLRAALDQLAAGLAEPDPRARVRFWLDRCFTIRGSGTVVTGTLAAGTIRLGDTLELRGRSVTVRGLQCLGAHAAQASGTARVALNLRGLARDDVHRGDVLLSPAAWRPSSVLDVRAAPGVDLPTRLVVHVGCAAVPATVRPLGTPADDALRVPAVRLRLAVALPLQVGDRLLLRDPGRRLVLGGATVLDPAPPALRGRGAARLRASDLLDHPGTPDLEGELSRRGAATATLLAEIGVAVPEPLPSFAVAAGGWLVAAGLWSGWLDGLAVAVDGGGGGLTDAGVAAADVARALGLPDLSLLAPLLAAARRFEEAGGRVRRRGSPVVLRADVATAVARLTETLRRRPFQAPEQPLLEALGLGARELGAAAAAGTILRLPGDVVLLPDAPGIAVRRLTDLAQPFTMSSARQALETSRRVAVPLLEYLDRTRATERVDGNLRRVRVARPAAT